jgi:Carboxypeptidase regulatory-like domain
MKSMFGKRLFSIFAFGLFIFTFAAVGFAQDLDDVTISGRVLDSNSAPIVGATVVATLIETNVERTVVADGEGRYRIVDLKPGTYKVKASATGFGAKEQIDLVTIAGQNVQLDFSLAPASVQAEQTVTIGAEDVPNIDTTRTVVGGTVTEKEIEELPNNTRNPLDLIFTLGGVTEEPLSTRDLANDKGARGEGAPSATTEEAGIFSLSGGAAYSNNITIDGLDNNDDRAATFRFQPSMDSISEVQVITNQFSAEYGRASGGRVNFRTRSGGKDFRGRLSYYFRDESLNANTWRNNSRNISRPSLQENIPYGSFSGPIPIGYFRNRTFFFVGYEYQNLFENTVIDTYVPVQQNPRYPLPEPTNPAGQINVGTVSAPVFVAPFVEGVPTPLRNHIFTTRIDHNFTDTHNITFNFQFGKRNDFRQFSGGSRLAESLLGTSRDTRAFNFTDNYVFSAKVVNQFRMQYSTLQPRVATDTALTAPVILITLPTLLDRGTTLISGSTTGSSDRDEKRWQFQDALTTLWGAHSLKFGFDVQRVNTAFIDRGDATGTFNFASPGTFLTTTVSRYRHNFGTTSEQENTYTGFFFQDEWKIRPNFTLSYGLRYERESIIDDTNNFGPRFAIAWDPFKKGTSVIRIGAGIFYNRALLRTIDDYSLTTSTLVFDTNAIPAGGVRDAVLAQISASFPTPLTQAQAQSICTANNLACGNTAFGRILDPTLKIPESYQINIGYEREIGKDFVFEANYTWNKTARLWREFNSNAISLQTLNARTGGSFNDFAGYLLSQSFNNAPVNGIRPFYNVGGARDQIRFVLSFTPPPVGDPTRCTGTIAPSNTDQGGCQIINGIPTTIINLNSQTAINSSPPITVALAVLNQFRPNPARTQLEQLASIGNAEYNGLILELRRRFRPLGFGFGGSMRFVYTLSKSMDDGIVNTSSAQFSGDFTSEWARSLQDRRHRFAFSGTIESPTWLGKVRFSPVLRIASSAPFNLSAGGVDRNLDDVNTDRPNFSNNPEIITWRAPGDPFPTDIFNSLSRATIGAKGGNLRRNAGHGPGLFLFDLNVSREFRFTERMRLRPNIEFNNVFNSVVFSYGTAFINQTDPQNTFLIPTRTYRPREIRVGLRFDF